MENYIIGELIKKIREERNMTQVQLSQILSVSEKTISKWETGRGLPDISLLEPLAKALNVSVYELINGKQFINTNKCSNMLKTKFYVCPICGNIITSTGEGDFSCCGNNLIPWEAEEATDDILSISKDYIYVSIESKMTKDDYITFIAYVTSDKVNLVKLYPEQNAEVSFIKQGHGFIYYFDLKNGLFKKRF